MIKIISDDNKTIEVADLDELKARVDEIFSLDPNEDVTVTYVVTNQPASRRMTSPPTIPTP